MAMERAPYPGAFLFIWVFLIRLAGLDERGVKIDFLVTHSGKIRQAADDRVHFRRHRIIELFAVRIKFLRPRAVRNLRFEFLLQSTVFFRKLRHIRCCLSALRLVALRLNCGKFLCFLPGCESKVIV